MVKDKNDYALFIKKVYLKVVVLFGISLGSLFFISLLLRGWFGNWFVNFIESTFYLNNEDALNIHQQLFRNNVHIFVIIFIVICSLIIFKVALLWVTKYFDEIGRGMDKLVSDDDSEIILSQEMNLMETKMNACRSILDRRERDAKYAEQRKNDLVVYLAHDIKTPLTSVIGYLDLLSEVPDMPLEQRSKYINVALVKANRLEKLINEFFEITRYNLQSIILEKIDFNLSYMIYQIADEFMPMVSENNQQIVINSNADIMFHGDPDKLARVFNNVLKNAIAYGSVNSKITIDINKEDNYVNLIFRNCGTKIPKEKLETIFEKFYRLDESRGTLNGNAGLGLAIAKEIISLHKGDISAESDDKETRFYIKIPGVVS